MPDRPVREELESDYDNGNGHSSSNGNGHSSSNGNGNGHSSSNGNGNGHSSNNGNGNGNGHSSSNGNGNGHSSSNGNGNGNGHEEHYDDYSEEHGQQGQNVYGGYQPPMHQTIAPPQKGFPKFQGGQMGPAQVDMYGQQQMNFPENIQKHQPKQTMPTTTAGIGGYNQGLPLDMGQQQMHGGFQGQPQIGYKSTQGGHQGFNQPQPQIEIPHYQKGVGNFSGQQQPIVQQPHPKHVHQVEQSLNYPMKSGPGSQPQSAIKPSKNYDTQLKTGGFARKDEYVQGDFGGDHWPEEEPYQPKTVKPNINKPPSQYYGKNKPDYYTDPYVGKGSRQASYQEGFADYDQQQAGYYEDESQEYVPVQSGGYSKQQQQYSGSHGTGSAYSGYDIKYQDKKKLPPATETTIKKHTKAGPTNMGVTAPALSQKSQQQVNPKTKKVMPPTLEEMNEAAMNQGNRPGIVAMTQVSGDQTTSWLQSAASPNEKFIDDTVENINRKPGFNRLKKKYHVREKKLQEYKARVRGDGDPMDVVNQDESGFERKSSGSSSKRNSDGGELQAGETAKSRTVDPKKKPNLDFRLEAEDNNSEHLEYGNTSENINAQDDEDDDMKEQLNEEQEFFSDDDGEEENSSVSYEREDIAIPQAQKVKDTPKMMTQDTKAVAVPIKDDAKKPNKSSDKVKVTSPAPKEKESKDKIKSPKKEKNATKVEKYFEEMEMEIPFSPMAGGDETPKIEKATETETASKIDNTTEKEEVVQAEKTIQEEPSQEIEKVSQKDMSPESPDTKQDDSPKVQKVASQEEKKSQESQVAKQTQEINEVEHANAEKDEQAISPNVTDSVPEQNIEAAIEPEKEQPVEKQPEESSEKQ